MSPLARLPTVIVGVAAAVVVPSDLVLGVAVTWIGRLLIELVVLVAEVDHVVAAAEAVVDRTDRDERFAGAHVLVVVGLAPGRRLAGTRLPPVIVGVAAALAVPS